MSSSIQKKEKKGEAAVYFRRFLFVLFCQLFVDDSNSFFGLSHKFLVGKAIGKRAGTRNICRGERVEIFI